MKKKLLAVLMTGIMAASFAGTATVVSADSGDDNTLTVWAWDQNFNIKSMQIAADQYAADHEGFSVDIIDPVMSYAVSAYVFLQADSEQDAAQAAKILQTRIDSQADGDAFYPETIDQWKAAKVLQNGAYVAMIASGEHQTEIEDAWNAQFGA